MENILDAKKGQNVITTTCAYDCGGRCLLKVHIKEGDISRISTQKKMGGQHIQACPLGLSQDAVLRDPGRLKQPMQRVGTRGTGNFEPIPWDEALQIITEQIQRVSNRFGTDSITFITGSGSLSTLHNTSKPAQRFFGLLGRCTTNWGVPSCEGAIRSSLATFGTPKTGNTRDNLKSSRLIILWGWNPLITRFGPDTVPNILQAKETGVKILCVDPRLSPSCRELADEWIPIKPGTDAALLITMAYVVITEGLYDEDYVEKYTFGFDSFYDYVTGKEDGQVKSPQWAQSICGVPAERIKTLARDYALFKPAALMTGWSPGRSAYGEQFHRAASVLATITGNIGVEGGHVSGGLDLVDIGIIKGGIPIPKTKHNRVHITDLYDALISGKTNGVENDCKLLYIIGCNMLNQYLNLNKGKKALLKPDFIVVHELFLTPTAQFADIVLPIAHYFEREDIGQPFLGGPYCIFMNKIIEAPPGVKSDLEIFSEIAERLGIEHYNDISDEEWLRKFLEEEPGFPDLETLKAISVHRFGLERPHVAFRNQIEDPTHFPFPTPSGKIEIFSHMFEKMNHPLVPAIPKYIPNWEGPEDPLTKSYPIQLISPHSRARINSQFDNIDKLKKMGDDDLWMNIEDAEDRGIKNGERVVVFNQRGRMVIPVKLTGRIMPGVASIDQGQWHKQGAKGIESGGCVNVLTLDNMSPIGAFPSNTCLVQIEKQAI